MGGPTNTIYVATPSIYSSSMSKISNGPKVFLKLENCQPTSTFKLRGISELVLKAKEEGYSSIVCSSGGNAGIAAAYSARALGLTANIVIPENSSKSIIHRLEMENPNIILHGKHWCEADEKARELSKSSYYVHPFDDPIIWKGHSSMISELHRDLSKKPSCIVLSVGGGGLLCGVVEGLRKIGWNDVPVIAVETFGADCYNRSLKNNRRVEMPEITSLAKCLGANMACKKSLEWFKKHPIHSIVLSDKDAASSCIKFANDHKMLVELACGVSLAALYEGHINQLISERKISTSGDIVIIVCGGSTVDIETVSEWKRLFNL